MRTQLELLEVDGTRIGPLDNAQVEKVVLDLDGPDFLTANLSLFHPLLTEVELGLTEIGLKVPGISDYYFYGTIWDWEFSGDSTRARLYCHDLERRFDDRLVESDLSLRDMDQAAIAWALINHTQTQPNGDLGIESGFSPTGVNRDRDYYEYKRENIGKRLRSFRNIQGGFDWTIKVLGDGRKEFQVYYPNRGSFKPDSVIEWGKNISNFKARGSGQTTNDIIAQGDGEGENRIEGRFTDSDDVALRGPRTDTVSGSDGMINASSLVNLAEGMVKKRIRNPPLSEVFIFDHEDLRIADIEPGDSFPVRINRGPLVIDSNYQVTSLEVNPLSDVAKLEIEEVV